MGANVILNVRFVFDETKEKLSEKQITSLLEKLVKVIPSKIEINRNLDSADVKDIPETIDTDLDSFKIVPLSTDEINEPKTLSYSVIKENVNNKA